MARRTIYEGRVVGLNVDTWEFADGERREREIVEHPGAVAIVAVDGAEVVLVRQHRAPAERVLLELPAGTRERRAGGVIEEPGRAAARELAEETGLRAGTWRHLARFWTAPGFATEVMDLYLATDLAPAAAGAAAPADDERLEVRRLRLEAALTMIEQGDIADAKTIVGLLWLARLREQGARGPRSPRGAAGPRDRGRSAGPSRRPGGGAHGPMPADRGA